MIRSNFCSFDTLVQHWLEQLSWNQSSNQFSGESTMIATYCCTQQLNMILKF